MALFPSYRNNNFSVFGLNIPRDLEFCGEKIPTNDYALKDNLEKEFFNNRYWRSSAGFLFNKASKWFPYLEPILKAEGVPEDFKYVAVIESHLSNATSSAGAVGFWQLVAPTARNYGLIVNDYVDERLDVEKATHVACKLIKDAHKTFNNWTLSAAAYNLGIGGIQKAMARQKTDNYYDLLLNRETGSFVYRILAYKTLFLNPQHFGLKRKSIKYSPIIPVKIVKIDSTITDIKHLAKALDVNVAIIRLFNPWLLKDELPNAEKRIYEFRIPKKPDNDYSGYYNDLLKRELGTDSLPEIIVNDSSAAPGISHIVGSNETLKQIAEFYNVSEKELRDLNKLNETSSVKEGQKILIKSEEK
jgi:LysM repeat protein